MKRMSHACGLLLAVSSSVMAAVNDDFNDNAMAPLWSAVLDQPAKLNVIEQNGRLEVISTGDGSTIDDALYLSNGPAGFWMATTNDFRIDIDYSFIGFTPVAPVPSVPLAMVFGVGKDLEGFDSAAIGITYVAGLPAFGITHRTNDVAPALPDAFGLTSASGTLSISYDAAGDDLHFAINGTTVGSLNNTVNAVWDPGPLLVSFGARGTGYATTSGQAYFDNFAVVSGTVVPEPATLALITLAGLPLLRRRRDSQMY